MNKNRVITERVVDQMMDQFLNRMSEYCDSVQVFATMQDRGTTCRKAKGSGNYYARIGVCREFLDRDTELTREDISGEEGDGD
jgi:hypothetical protein